MSVAPDGVVSVGNHARKRITDIATLDNRDGLLDVPNKEDEGKNNTRGKDPLVNFERDFDISKGNLIVGNAEVRAPSTRDEQVDGGPQIGAVDEDTLDDDGKDEQILELAPGRVVDVILNIDKVEFVVLNLLPSPIGWRKQ